MLHKSILTVLTDKKYVFSVLYSTYQQHGFNYIQTIIYARTPCKGLKFAFRCPISYFFFTTIKLRLFPKPFFVLKSHIMEAELPKKVLQIVGLPWLKSLTGWLTKLRLILGKNWQQVLETIKDHKYKQTVHLNARDELTLSLAVSSK